MDKKTAYHVLHLIDKSIIKWKNIVYKDPTIKQDRTCPLCDFFAPDFDTSIMPGCSVLLGVDIDTIIICPIFKYTKYPQCTTTPFYKTSLRFIFNERKYSPKEKIPNNHMLSFLYELRLWYINQLNQQKYEYILKLL